MNMDIKMLRNDFKRNRAGNVSLLLFMTLATCLVVVATIVVIQIFTSMMGMYDTAQPPHFLQMHKGEIDQTAIDEFNSSYEGVTAWQTVPMINVYGDDLTVHGEEKFRLSESRMDISLVKQNQEYDLLLDNERNTIQVNPGEIGIPVILLDAYDIKLGDRIELNSKGVRKEFQVAAFVHDAQMNSTLVSSTRMLISDEDFETLFGNMGETEYLIETYFTDSSMAPDFRTAYEKAGLPQDGQAVTYTMIFLLSAFRDIAMAMVLILVSILLIVVSLMCMKFTVMATLEEEVGEIGTMKAIGISFKDIRNLYLVKYRVTMAVGIILGYAVALIVSGLFTGHISNTFGKQSISMIARGLPVVVCMILYFITSHYCKKILKQLKRLTVVDALVAGKGFGKKNRVRDGLYKAKNMPVNFLVSARETLHNFGGFIIVFMVMFIVIGIMIVPVNLINTMESKEFISYMGSSMDDILVEIDLGEELENKAVILEQLLGEDEDIASFSARRRVRVETIDAEDEWMNLHIDSGVDAGKELKYLAGVAPSRENEIALSTFNADEMGKGPGEKITITVAGKQKEFVITGVYQDVTSGGYTAKATYDFAGVDTEKYQFSIILAKGVDAGKKAAQWSEKLGSGYDIVPMEDFIYQTVGGVSRQVKIATTAVTGIGFLLAALVIVLFMKLRLVKDVSQIAALKAIGFTNTDVRKQYLYKMLLVSTAGIIAGTLVSNLLGENIVSMVFGMTKIGISRITFIINPWTALILYPVLLLLVAAGISWISTRQIQDYNIISLINE